MADYGSNAEVQKLAFGATSSDQDDRCASVRKVATSFVNAHLDLSKDIASPSNLVNDATNLISAGLILTGQMTVDSINEHPFVKLAMTLLEKLKGDQTTDAHWRTTIPVERF